MANCNIFMCASGCCISIWLILIWKCMLILVKYHDINISILRSRAYENLLTNTDNKVDWALKHRVASRLNLNVIYISLIFLHNTVNISVQIWGEKCHLVRAKNLMIINQFTQILKLSQKLNILILGAQRQGTYDSCRKHDYSDKSHTHTYRLDLNQQLAAAYPTFTNPGLGLRKILTYIGILYFLN